MFYFASSYFSVKSLKFIANFICVFFHLCTLFTNKSREPFVIYSFLVAFLDPTDGGVVDVLGLSVTCD